MTAGADPVAFSIDIACVLGVLAIAVLLLVSKIVRADLAAVLIMVLLALLTLLPGLAPVELARLFDGFASNATLSIIALMILGAGLVRTALLERLAPLLLNRGRATVPLLATCAGLMSSFVLNTSSAALLLPVAARLSAATRLPLSRLLMPMGFCAILGGTLTMVGSGPLVLLNDLLAGAVPALPDMPHPRDFTLFAIAPVGAALLAAGVLYFAVLGGRLLPAGSATAPLTGSGRTAEYFSRVYGLDAAVYEIRIPRDSALQGRRLDVLERAAGVRFLAYYSQGYKRLAPPGDTLIDNGAIVAVMAGPAALKHFVERYALEQRPQLRTFADELIHTRSGVVELALPPDSKLIDARLGELSLRTRYGLSLLALHRDDATLKNLDELTLRAGDMLVCHSSWENLARLEQDRDFVIVTGGYPRALHRPHKVFHALGFFFIAIALALFSELPLSVALLTGALGMVLSGVLSIDDAYDAIRWRTVFLLASLLSLGRALQDSGTAVWASQQLLLLTGAPPAWALQALLALLTTALALLMPNLGATVLMVPFAVNLALAVGADPALFALTVAVAACNTFVLPTHPISALIMRPGGYRGADFLRVGGGLTALFFVISLVMLNLVF